MKITLATPKDFSLFPHVPGEAFTLAMEVESEQVAFAHFYQSEELITLVDLFVVPEHSGKNYGRTLLTELSRNAAQSVSGKLEWTTSNFEAAVGTLFPFSFKGEKSKALSA